MGYAVYVPRDITSCRLLINGQLDVCVSRYNQLSAIAWNDEKNHCTYRHIRFCTIASNINQTTRAILCHEGWVPHCTVNPNRILYQLWQQSVHLVSTDHSLVSDIA